MPTDPKSDQPPKKGSQKRSKTSKPEDIPDVLEEENDWKEYATFIVRFERKTAGDKEEKRTTIEHHETGEQAKPPWPGIETREVCQWMLERLGEEETVETGPKEEAPQVESPSPIKRPIPESVAIEIIGIQAFQPPSTDQPQDLFAGNRALTGYVKGGEPLSFTVNFQLTGLGAHEMVKGGKEFGAVFNAEDLFNSTITQIGVTAPDLLKEGQFSYSTWLAPLTLSPGVYRLKILTTVRDIQPLWVFTEIPLLQVA